MQQHPEQYLVLTGNFGSGKSDIALNTAIKAADAGKKVLLVDLDMINPYFRSSERRDLLAAHGVEFIYPDLAFADVEMLTVPPEVYGAFAGGRDLVIFDVGGDANGALALGQFRPFFSRIPAAQLAVRAVINPRRPLCEDAEHVLALLAKMQMSSRLKIDGLINNGNMQRESSAEDLLLGYQVLKEVAEETGLPVVQTWGLPQVLAEFTALAAEQQLDEQFIGEKCELTVYMHRDWESLLSGGLSRILAPDLKSL
jgi:hypothetical protein